ncbi:hypothetical protein EV356DRAFT_510845 [Viridothelium virens]|uniref:Uncharacterized protein n=1 Tax=Viridothelium virens TaxID=1048519 RepID=A0A6A6GV63_VIRVR|nr:hypothetical protein EV356DRAFT_510845 [Viridothelium virens]
MGVGAFAKRKATAIGHNFSIILFVFPLRFCQFMLAHMDLVGLKIGVEPGHT